MSGLEALTSMDYPGRFIALGLNPEGMPAVVYGITGRSESSKARKLVLEKSLSALTKIKVEPIDAELVNKGNPDLLLYDAVIVSLTYRCEMIVGNGKQTKRIDEALC